MPIYDLYCKYCDYEKEDVILKIDEFNGDCPVLIIKKTLLTGMEIEVLITMSIINKKLKAKTFVLLN